MSWPRPTRKSKRHASLRPSADRQNHLFCWLDQRVGGQKLGGFEKTETHFRPSTAASLCSPGILTMWGVFGNAGRQSSAQNRFEDRGLTAEIEVLASHPATEIDTEEHLTYTPALTSPSHTQFIFQTACFHRPEKGSRTAFLEQPTILRTGFALVEARAGRRPISEDQGHPAVVYMTTTRPRSTRHEKA